MQPLDRCSRPPQLRMAPPGNSLSFAYVVRCKNARLQRVLGTRENAHQEGTREEVPKDEDR